MSQATSLSRTTITEGIRELTSGAEEPPSQDRSRIRRPGGGRKPLSETDPELMEALESLVNGTALPQQEVTIKVNWRVPVTSWISYGAPQFVGELEVGRAVGVSEKLD